MEGRGHLVPERAPYRKLAENAATCLRKGDPVIVRGRFIVRDYEDKNGAKRTAVEVDAISVGHDLNRGVAQFQRVRPQTGLTAVQFQEIETGPGGVDTDAFAGITGLSERGPGRRRRGRGRRDARTAPTTRAARTARTAGTAGRSTRRPWTRCTEEAASAAVPF